MANLKDISTVPELNALEGTEKVLLNVDGSAKQARVDLIKPAEEWDLDIEVAVTMDTENSELGFDYTVNKINTYANIKNKIFNGELPKCKSKSTFQPPVENLLPSMEVAQCNVVYYPEGFDGPESPEYIMFCSYCAEFSFMMILTSDDMFQGVFPF